MSKRLPKTEDVARAWATQSQDGGHAASASFAGPRLISYRTCVGVLLTGAEAQKVALVCESRFSTTTAVLLGIAANEAHKAGYLVFRVWNANEQSHGDNLKRMADLVREMVAAIENARKPADRRVDARHRLNKGEAYAEVFGLKFSDYYDGPAPEVVLSKAEREARA